jgi:hypothetical protein
MSTYTAVGSNDEHNLTFILHFNDGARTSILLTGAAKFSSLLFTRQGDPGAYFNRINFFLPFIS